MLITGKTKTGFSYQFQKEQVEDYEFVELIGEVDENPLMFPKVMTLLFGKDQMKKLKEHVRNEDGFVPVEKMIEEFKEVMANPKLKNF